MKTLLNNMHKELKAANREIRDQSLKLRQLERQNAMLTEAYNEVRSEIHNDHRKFTKSERNKYIEHFEVLEE